MPKLTLFTAPKPFTDDHIARIQSNAIRSWLHLGSDVEVLLVGDEEGIADFAAETGVSHLLDIERNELGTPLLNSIFRLAQERAKSSILCYVNTDIIFLNDLLQTVPRVSERFNHFLIVGQRWDLNVEKLLHISNDWEQTFRRRLERDGQMHPPTGSDYFIFPKGLFLNLPPFTLGRAGWDNWMIFAGRADRLSLVDASEVITAVHQNHDYSHLPGGQPHYRLPESKENIRLGGGRETVFELPDANWKITRVGIRRTRITEVGISRWLEAGLIARAGPGKRARLIHRTFHPLDTVTYYIRAAFRRLKRIFS